MQKKQSAGVSAENLETHRAAFGVCQRLQSFDSNMATLLSSLGAVAAFLDTEFADIKKSIESAGGFSQESYGKGLVGLFDAHSKWARGAGKSVKDLQAAAAAVAKSRESLPDAGAFAQVQIQNGGRDAPGDHAQLHRALSFMTDPAAIESYLKQFSSVWGIVGGWRWLSEGDSKVDEAFIYAAGGKKSASVRVATIRKLGDNKTRPEIVPALASKLSEAEAKELLDWAYWGRVWRRGRHEHPAPSEALTAKVADILGVVPSGEYAWKMLQAAQNGGGKAGK